MPAQSSSSSTGPNTNPGAEYQPRFMWRFLLPHYWPAWLLVLLIASMIWWPQSLKRGLARWLGCRLLGGHAKRRHIVDVNLKLCFPEIDTRERNKLRDNFFQMAAQVLLDYGLLWFASNKILDKQIAIEGEHYLQEAMQGGQNIILLTCHSLALEYGALAITRRHPTIGLIKPARNALFEWLIARGRTRFQGRLIERHAGIRHIVKAVKKGMLFYYLPDEDLGESQQTTFAPFFNVSAATLTSLGRLSQLCQSQVVPCFSRFDVERGMYVLDYYPALSDFPSGDEAADATRMNQVLEQMIRTAPEQYLWSFRIFQTRPPGETTLYGE